MRFYFEQMNIFYQPEISTKSFLNEEDSKHCVKVLRKTLKEKIIVVDGFGGFFECEITKPHEKKCEFNVISVIENYNVPQKKIHIAIAPTKNSDRLEWFVEKAVEVGINEISLIETQHSERRFQKTDRLEKIAISAMKQSLKAFLPKINELTKFQKFITNVKDEDKFIAHLEENPQQLAKQNIQENICILIGPEGDFSENEVDLAKKNGFRVVALGNSRLRTETAGLVACTILNNI